MKTTRQELGGLVGALLATAVFWALTREASPAAPSAVVPYSALNTNDFRITNRIVGVRSSLGGGTNVFNTIYVTNITYTSNLYATNIHVSNIFVTNIDASVTVTTNLYVTNIFNTFLVTSNIVAGNINGTTNTLAMFTPDQFSVGDSIVTQPDTNTIVVHGAGTGYIGLGPSTGMVFLARSTNDFHLTNVNGLALSVAEVSGYSGSGLLALTDDGTYKAFAASGDALWTNLGGLLQPKDLTLPVMLTNRLRSVGFGGGSATDYSRLAIFHAGTNGAVVFDSQSAGTAGDPRPFVWNWQGTNIAVLNNSASAVFLIVTNPASSTRSQFGTTSGGHAMVLADASKQVYLSADNDGGGTYIASSTAFLPAHTGGTNDLGTVANAWRGLYLVPMTKAQRNTLTAADGLVIYQSDATAGLHVYSAGAWYSLNMTADP